MARELTAGSAGPVKARAAALSVASNTTLILLKVAAGSITGSVAVLSEAMHSSVDLIASLVAYVSVRKADEPADAMHRYGHEKIEHLSAAIEGMLILVGSGVIIFEAVRRLASNARVHTIGLGIAVIGLSAIANLVVGTIVARRARATASPALEGDAAHLRTDALTSTGVLAGLALAAITGERWIDPVVALALSAAIVVSGLRILTRSSRVLVDEALPAGDQDAIGAAVRAFADAGVAGYHKLRTRRAGARRYVDLHVQFRAGTTLEAAHATAHRLQDEIRARIDGADVLIHLEPEDRLEPGTELQPRGTSRD